MVKEGTVERAVGRRPSMAAQQACGGLLEGSSNKNKEKEITLNQFHGPNQCLERNKTGNVAQEVWCGVGWSMGKG